ncbi:ABC transporter substrate-binding protein [Bradyrhizobium sp. 190]|uniref:ABC transporter substrate-binding protein n=1 Tax=Bradyrhizobium sp. 190 TaxID=2782658 RepID=UPI001FF801AE|nr:ABC transporter substrate-binding protein [Bradyrhizobium sp. 190]MCK1513111.1 ABC transporter substrate-binding protein [Bradyrhizobium sp. 190]
MIALFVPSAHAQKLYDPGANDAEIKIGNIMPYSGPLSALSVIAKFEAAYLTALNERGGINGRKIKFISYDDAYSPPKTVEQARKLVESDEVLFLFSVLGTPTNSAIQKYTNARKIPHLFVASGATKWGDHKGFPWTIGFQPSYQTEARIFAKYVSEVKPGAKIAVFYQNDDFGKDMLNSFKERLAAGGPTIAIEESYDVSEPTIDTHVVKMKASGADTLMIFASTKYAAQTIKKTAELDWKPLRFLTYSSSFIESVIRPAGFEAAQGIISASYLKDPSDPQWNEDEGMKTFKNFYAKHVSDSVRMDDQLAGVGYSLAQTLEQVVRQCGDDLTRANIMKQAANLKDFSFDLLLPGIKVNTSPVDFYPIKQMRLMRLEGETWKLFGPAISE